MNCYENLFLPETPPSWCPARNFRRPACETPVASLAPIDAIACEMDHRTDPCRGRIFRERSRLGRRGRRLVVAMTQPSAQATPSSSSRCSSMRREASVSESVPFARARRASSRSTLAGISASRNDSVGSPELLTCGFTEALEHLDIWLESFFLHLFDFLPICSILSHDKFELSESSP